MFDDSYHRKIAQKLRDMNLQHIENEKENGYYNKNEKPMMKDNTLKTLIGSEKLYKKQVPVIGGAGKPNMEIADVVNKRGRKKLMMDMPMVYQDQMDNFEGGNMPNYEDEYNDTRRYKEEEMLGSGLVSQDALNDDIRENNMKRQLGGSKKIITTNTNTKTKRTVETVEGSETKEESDKEDKEKKRVGRPKKEKVESMTPVVEKKKPGRPKKVKEESIAPVVEKRKPGRPKKEKVEEPIIEEEIEIEGSGSGESMIKRRANLIKKIMKEKGLSLIKASQYIKANKLKY